MNLIHHWYCQSTGWSDVVAARLPWALKGLALGSDVLEIGPGFGVTTELIHPIVDRLTCVEIDHGLAERLRHRMSGRNVTIIREDAASMSFSDDRFDSVVCFTMLHHVPSVAMQDRLFSESARVLRPGGIFAGSDSISSWRFRMLHVFDTMVPVDPHTLPERLRSAGFAEVEVKVNSHRSAFRFRAKKPI